MPTKYFNIKEIEKSQLDWDETEIDTYSGRFAGLIPTDENGEPSYSLEGRYRVASEITFPNVILGALTSFWSFEESAGYSKDEDDDNLGTIDYQLSNDDGVIWKYWTGSIWETAGANDWSDENDIQDNIATFAFVAAGIKQIKVKARLSPDSDNLASPILYGLAIHYELDFIPEEDVVRSLIVKLENELEIITEVAIELGAASTSFKPPIDVKILEVIGVWNTTDDPSRLSNIFSSLSQTLIETKETGEEIYDQTINITPSQDSGDTIIARLKVHIYIYIAPDADYILGEIPKITIEVGDFAEDMDFRNDGNKIEKNKAKSKARIRKQPTTYRMPVRVLSYSSDELLAKEMDRAVIRLLTNKAILSLATAEELQITNESEFASANIVREDLSVKIFAGSIVFRDYDTHYDEVPLVETFTTIIDKGGA